jgi:hypothetical protein
MHIWNQAAMKTSISTLNAQTCVYVKTNIIKLLEQDDKYVSFLP